MGSSTPPAFRFDPDRVAFYETAGWRAYYDRAWLKLLWLIVALSQEQFRIPFPISLVAAYHVVRAAISWVPLEHDAAVVRRSYEKFYRIARRYSGLAFDPARVSALELQYNDVHRRLVGDPDKSEFIQIMVDLHAALFGLPVDRVRESAELRVLAATTVDQITSHTSTDVAGDWVRVEDALRRCYRSLARELAAD